MKVDLNSLAACNMVTRSVENFLVKPLGNKLASIFDGKVVTFEEYCNRAIFSKNNEYNFKDQMIGFIACTALMLSVGALAVSI
ncbi:MAG: hypothetical protein KR126chlam6_00387 [Candidatus Anoxychlamydiales bacterium]|nr:hypothetical protein [Candidatus Anoxychlamydiales bacterium]